MTHQSAESWDGATLYYQYIKDISKYPLLTRAEENEVLLRIKAGDTLSRIASLYKTTVQQIQAWNGLRSTQLAAGRTLTIYTSRPF